MHTTLNSRDRQPPGRVYTRHRACLVVGLLCFSGCEVDTETKPHDTHPIAIAARIGGIFGPSYDVVLNDSNSVVYSRNPTTFTSYPGTEHEIIRVSEERWISFRQALDQAKVWTWKSAYVDPDIYDGTSWGLVAQYADKSIDTHGRNAYPKKKQFERFLQAVRDLIGGKDFR